jgi:hypothetical protein
MTPDHETDIANIQSLIGMWRDEEERLRSIIKDPQTSPSVKEQVTKKLGSVLDQIRSYADELHALEQTE